MPSLKLLKQLGVTQPALKAAFTDDKIRALVLDPQAKKKKDDTHAEKVARFVKRASDRIQEAIENATRDYRVFAAIDSALDSPFFQVSYSMFRGLLDSGKMDDKRVLSAINRVKEWGFGGWLKTECGCGGGCTNMAGCKLPQQTVDIPCFFEVDFPICLAYLRIRVARMFNERNLTPLFQYTPSVSTPEDRLRCQLVTHRVSVQAEQMNYRAILRQMIHQSTAYGGCILFPKEAWFSDQQPTDEMNGKKRVMKTEREGVRYDHPHPCRMYYDLAYPAYTLNSDTGCRYLGYWTLVRYGDVATNPDYWNTDEITYGKDTFRITDTNRTFFETVYPCTMSFPEWNSDSVNVGPIDREKRLKTYTQAEDDKAVLLTNHFEKLNPLKDLGLKNKAGDGYDGDVWFRFVFAADDTVVYAEPLAYRPGVWSGYDADANRFRNASLVLEAISAQDMVHNLFSQAILQAKNNLASINFVNRDVIDKPVLDELKNYGEKTYRRPIFVEYSKHEGRSMGDEKQDAIIPVPIQRMPIGDLLTLVKGVLDLLERTLVMSAQEIASTASHEQTAQEVLQTAQSTSTRLAFTGSYIDDAIWAWQTQLFDAGMAYWDDEMFGEVAIQEEADEKRLEELGFKIESVNETERTAGVRGSKKGLEVAQFTQRRNAADRVRNSALAAQMVQLFQVFAANETLIQTIGAGQLVKVFNEIANIAGLPRDFRLSVVNDVVKETREFALEDRKMAKEDRALAQKQAKEQGDAQNVMQQLQTILPQIMEKVKQETVGMVGEQLKPVFEKAAEVDQQQSEQIQQIVQAVQQVGQVTGENKQAIEKIAQIIAQAMQPQAPQQGVPIPPQLQPIGG